MKRVATILTIVLAAAVLAGSAAADLRSPQVVFSSASLQAYLNGVGENINVLTAQQEAQIWKSTVSGNSTFTLMIELTGNAALNTYGIYGGADGVPVLAQVFPGAAMTGWFATASFRESPTRVIVNLFDANAVLLQTNTYTPGPDRNDFAFYLQGPGGTFYTQDARNAGGNPQMLTYAGTGVNFGSWWLCFEDTPFGTTDVTDFDDAVMFLESANPTPVNTTSWGQLKARYR
jgi:hypothetical protein